MLRELRTENEICRLARYSETPGAQTPSAAR